MWNKYVKSENGSERKFKCANVDEFLNFLTKFPSNEIRNPRTTPSELIFRGHSDSRYKLIPNAFRSSSHGAPGDDFMWKLRAANDNDSRYCRSNFKPGHPAGAAYRSAELQVIAAFYSQADRAGLPLPHISQELHRELITGNPGALSAATLNANETFKNRTVIRDWPVTEIIPIIALAQHYGLPTRLLDWTWSSPVAAYFAASSCIKGGRISEDDDHFLSVWATVADQLQIPISDEQGHPAYIHQNHEKIFRLQPPVHSNPNQKLQQGLFTFSLDRVHSGGNPEDEVVTALKAQNELCDQDKPQFFQLLLPAHMAPELLKRLHTMGFMKARIIEGFAGVAASVRESVDLATTIWSD